MKKNDINIGLKVNIPKKECSDKHCPFHSGLKIRGRIFNGIVVSKDAHKTCKVQWPRRFYLPKYERYEKRRSILKVHNPPCIDAIVGDNVTIVECKPISKTKKFVIIQKNEISQS